MLIEYEGRRWEFETPPPSFAMTIRNFHNIPETEMLWEIRDVVMDWMALDDWVDFYSAWNNEELPDDAIPEIFMRWLEAATGKPMSAVGALCNVAVRSWSAVRGRLVMSGIPNPMDDIRTLAALLDAVDMMIREGHKDEKETAKYEREVYRPRAKSGSIEKPAGFESDDMAAQAAMLAALAE